VEAKGVWHLVRMAIVTYNLEEMAPTDVTLANAIAALKPKAVDQFSRWAIEGAERALADSKNPLRLNFFSTAMRILFEHMMDTLAPGDQVARSSWFKQEREDGRPTRWQRIVFAIQGGLSESFVRQELQIDPLPLRQRLLATIDELSKHVHGRENTIILERGAQDELAKTTVAAMTTFLDTLHDCRAAVLGPVADALDEAAVDTLVGDTIAEVDELASHHSIEEVYVDNVAVHAIGPDTVIYRATGSVAVILQWGSNSDVSRGDGIELDQSFPFRCDIEVPLSELWDLSFGEVTCGVDTGEWRDRMGPDDL
jgi:hypothetical protein